MIADLEEENTSSFIVLKAFKAAATTGTSK